MKRSHPHLVKQSNPKAGYLSHKSEIKAAIQRVLESGWYILGHEVDAFEKAFAAYVGVKHAIGVANGTDALELALRACGVGPGDLVFTVSHTAVATIAAIELAGATPVFIDIDPATYTMDPDSLARALARPLKGRPKAVIPVHLYGQPADMPAILKVARRYGLKVVEDCAQAHGARLQGRMAGTWGDMAAFSFYPTKNLGALGDGGMVVTNNAALAEKVRLLQQYGWRQRYISAVPGCNSRLDEIQAAVLRVKLQSLDKENTKRGKLAGLYASRIAGHSLTLPAIMPGAEHVFHQFVVRTSRRDDLRAYLEQLGIKTLIHYPVPVHLQPAYKGRVKLVTPLINTEKAARQILSLPIYPELSEKDVRLVAKMIIKWEGGL
ncbi:MAG TPA: erythromycin biosynthesis sensory transduction protein eryC1 [Elusimicrobia bacterium]|nr:MAG: erythromycin biosynthesis sensory transduction protein eryC1 [Elusimicrobia bacterium GWF2_62_30]HBA59359.1 erythromycin biosynthesis sensory transduction protein eryC1 [Elusimicrobiota bacterium]